ncbi:hypothetical protein S7711_03855 [Stachybotrys chartarum IBT 7711]|uniref:Uncharacterized protein n=1 Tax=Stachybotrys chartarum (strain CBS 109288 / IBT 7711) TaxID=1280523 RepID=A0A084AHS8_STACB|nr:hypothetical protein S7711_03855 [Stachybotrys chartarum IBT 7711]
MAAAEVLSSRTSVGEYLPQHFQSLPSLEVAKDRFLDKAKGEELIKEVIKDFFVKAGMDRTFGVAMLHRHFDLADNEKLVEYEGTSTPWEGTVTAMRAPQEAIWGFDRDGVLRPTEFYYSEKMDNPLSENALRFIAKFKTLLDSMDLTESLGLAHYPGDDFQGTCEFTQGRANINLKPKDYPTDLKHTPTVWYFSQPLWTRGCRCTCNANTTNHDHGRHVYTTSG